MVLPCKKGVLRTKMTLAQDLHKLGVQEGDLLHMDNTVQMHKPVAAGVQVALGGVCARPLEAAPLLPAHRGDRRQGAPQSQAGAKVLTNRKGDPVLQSL